MNKKEKIIIILVVIGIIIVSGIAIEVINNNYTQKIVIGGLSFQIPNDYNMKNDYGRFPANGGVYAEASNFQNNNSSFEITVFDSDITTYIQQTEKCIPMSINGVNGMYYRNSWGNHFIFNSNERTISYTTESGYYNDVFSQITLR